MVLIGTSSTSTANKCTRLLNFSACFFVSFKNFPSKNANHESVSEFRSEKRLPSNLTANLSKAILMFGFDKMTRSNEPATFMDLQKTQRFSNLVETVKKFYRLLFKIIIDSIDLI